MAFFTNSKKENEQIRGISDNDLSRLDDIKIVAVGLARFMEAMGCSDDVLINELYKRGGKTEYYPGDKK